MRKGQQGNNLPDLSRSITANEVDEYDMRRLWGDVPSREDEWPTSQVLPELPDHSRMEASMVGAKETVKRRAVGGLPGKPVHSKMYGKTTMPQAAPFPSHPKCPACASAKIRWFIKRSWGTRACRWVYCLTCDQAFKEEEIIS